MGYANLKDKLKNKVRESINNNMLLNVVIPMFEYDTVDLDTYTTIETYLKLDGLCGLKFIDNTVKAFCVIGCGKMLNNGLWEKYNLYSLFNSEHYHNQIENKDFILIRNNATNFNDIDNIERYGNIFKETDVAQLLCIKGTKIQRLLQCGNSIIKTQVDNALENSTDGKEITFVNDDDFFTDSDGVKSIDLYNSNQVALIQYLTTYRESLLKRFFNIYGMTTFNSTKQAQQTNDEINSGNTIPLIYPLEMLKYRRNAINKFNKLYGTNINVHFSECLQHEYDSVFKKVEKEEKPLEEGRKE